MAKVKFKTQYPTEQAGQIHLVWPEDITVIDEMRGRKFKPTKEQFEDLAAKIIENGQQQPCLCRVGPEGNLILVYGRTRYDIIERFNSEQKTDDTKRRLKVEVDYEMDEAGALVAAYIENTYNKPSAVDQADTHAKLREKGLSDADIARRCAISPSYVSKLKTLSTANQKIQAAVHRGSMAINDAIAAARQSEKSQESIAKVVEEAEEKTTDEVVKDGTGDGEKKPGRKKPKSKTSVTKAAREATRQAANKSSGNSATVTRSLKDLKEAIGTLAQHENDQIGELCKSILKYISGKTSETQLENAFIKLAKSEWVEAAVVSKSQKEEDDLFA